MRKGRCKHIHNGLQAVRRAQMMLESCEVCLDNQRPSPRAKSALRKAQSEVEDLEYALCDMLGIDPETSAD